MMHVLKDLEASIRNTWNICNIYDCGMLLFFPPPFEWRAITASVISKDMESQQEMRCPTLL
jgi:hypothetical protein